MKKLLKLTFLAGFIFISASVMGKDKDFSLSFRNVTAKTFSFEVSNARNLSLVIYSADNNEIFSENIKKEESVEKSYNLEDLSSGTYFLVAESDQKIEKYKIVLDGDKINVDKTPVFAIQKPEYTVDNNKVKLHISNIEGEVKVSVYDAANNLYYSKTGKGENGELNMKFDFNPENSDAYIISVDMDGNNFNKVIALR